jgi:uncharacterized metal-binding protein
MESVMILPCNGVGNPLSTVTRYAALRTAELLREQGIEVEIMAIGRLLARLEDDVEAARKMPVALIEGCSFRCATKLLKTLGIEIASYVYVPEVMLSAGIGRRNLDRKFLGPKGRALVEAVAKATADALLAAPEPVAAEGGCE